MSCIQIIRRALSSAFVTMVSVSCVVQSIGQEGIQHFTETPSGLGSASSPAFMTELPVPSQTLPPKLFPSQIEQEILHLYSDNGECELPCFWGIIPGQTTIRQINDRLSVFADLRDDTRANDRFNNHKVTLITVQAPPEVDTFHRENWTFRIVTQEDIVEGITTNSTYIKQTSVPTMSNMLVTFGKPEEIWIAIMPYVPQYDVDTDYEIALFYPSKGILIMGSGIAHILAETDKGVKVSICPQMISETIDMDRHYPFSFHLWSPKHEMSFTDLTDTQLFGHEFFSIFDSSESSMNSEEFFETYVNPSATQCFELTQ